MCVSVCVRACVSVYVCVLLLQQLQLVTISLSLFLSLLKEVLQVRFITCSLLMSVNTQNGTSCYS